MRIISRPEIWIISLFFLSVNGCQKDKIPVISTTEITDIAATSAISGGTITKEGSSPIISRGVCWNTSEAPTITNSKTTESGELGAFTSKLIQLTPNTMYYVRAYAVNNAGTAYGNEVSFTTSQVSLPVLTTTDVTSITKTTAVSGGNITADNGGSISARGVCWSTSQSPTLADSKTTDGSGTGTFSSTLIGLIGNTTYYVRAYATNSAGTGYGTGMTFTTLVQIPYASTGSATNVSTTTATLNGTVNADYLSSTVTFEYGITTSYGSTSTALQSPVTGNTNTAVSANITGLTAGTIYHYRVNAATSLGTTYGKDLIYKTYNGTVTDIEGNVYYTISIGIQTWMAENLKTTMYNDGTFIPQVIDATAWGNLSVPGYCWYDNNRGNYKATLGALYNWYTVKTGKLCPSGWHVPTNAEWTSLTTYLGGESVAGSKLKESGTTHWGSPYETILESTNESGFTALPGGFRFIFGDFLDVGVSGQWWTAEEDGASWAWHRSMWYGSSNVYRNHYLKVVGISVRCIKD